MVVVAVYKREDVEKQKKNRKVVIYLAVCSDVVQGCMNGVPNEKKEKGIKIKKTKIKVTLGHFLWLSKSKEGEEGYVYKKLKRSNKKCANRKKK